MAKALDHHCGEYTQFLSAEPHRTQVHRRQRLFTPFPLREIPVPDTRIYDIQPGERGRDLRAERIEIVSGLLLPFLRVHKETRKKITFEEYKALSREQQQEYNVIPTYKYYSVFNLDQTNFSDVRPEEWEALREKFRGGQAEQPEIDAMLEAKSWFCPIREQQGDRAFYSPLADYIVVPLRSQFVDMQSFYETLLHEMGHSTGHPTRLNRDLAHPFGSEEYGKEELTAEFAAALAGMFFGIAEHIRTENAAYLKSWIYVGCSQNHPYCGEWLPNQVFRKRGLRPIRGAGHSNSLFQRETDSREGCRHGRSRMEN